ncbi:hypothetical protein [Lysinibacillus sp. NPDC093692]|uniref:hypothetical protein n=1 Tax=Lysinibacillus sp. NPDC093692 TaxID=3390578 RepID=UPI003D0889A3
MNKTVYFEELDSETKMALLATVDKGLDYDKWKKCNTEENRSVIFELEEKDIIFKVLKEKGVRDVDINALIDLSGIKYFPKLYAYSERKYLFMEKAKGVSLHDLLLRKQISNEELQLIKDQVLDAYTEMLNRKRDEHDFKLEHIFWDTENQKLTWIDLGFCEELVIYLPSKEKMIEKFEEQFKEELIYYGVQI